MSNHNGVQVSLLSLLAIPLDEPNRVRRTRAQFAREAAQRDYIAHLLLEVLWTAPVENFDAILTKVHERDEHVSEHQAFMAFSDRFSGRIVRVTANNHCELLIPREKLFAINFLDLPPVGAAKMMALYALARTREPIEPQALLQTLYDGEQEDLSIRIALWKLLNSGEVLQNAWGDYQLSPTTKTW